MYQHLNGSGLMGFTDVTDEELDGIIQSYKATHPNDGEQIITGYLRSVGICIPMRRYHVDAPNEVWHMDGNHKLIQGKFVIHGAIDGFSRLIAFLKCSTNNRAETVLQGFVTATLTYGLPRELRTDMGGENVDAWHYMIQQHGNERCVIVGSSVHNERIGRLWRDVHRAVVSPLRSCS